MSQVIGHLSQEQLQQIMGMVNAGGMPGAGPGAMRGMPPGSGGAGGAGGNVIRLTEEEGAAVARLAELGFDRTDAAQVRVERHSHEGGKTDLRRVQPESMLIVAV